MSEKETFKVVSLAWPKTIDGVLYERVRIKRMTAAQVSSFVDALQQTGVMPPLPMVEDEGGNLVGAAIVSRLDDDDAYTIEAAIEDFLPRRLKEIEQRILATAKDMSLSSRPSSPASEAPSSSTGATSSPSTDTPSTLLDPANGG